MKDTQINTLMDELKRGKKRQQSKKKKKEKTHEAVTLVHPGTFVPLSDRLAFVLLHFK